MSYTDKKRHTIVKQLIAASRRGDHTAIKKAQAQLDKLLAHTITGNAR